MTSSAVVQLMQKTPLYDYGRVYKSVVPYTMVAPRTPAEVQDIVRTARQYGTPLRMRAGGHTFSGATLPREGELLLRLQYLAHYRFEAPGTITVGAGAMLWDVRDFLRSYGLQLPVYNGGWGGPTVGGFICSGGMGCWRWGLDNAPNPDFSAVDTPCLSAVHGGFWENVLAVTLVDGRGDLQEVTPSDETFPWLFGSFGQLGIIVEARLKVLPISAKAAASYPAGQVGTIPRVQPEDPRLTEVPPLPFFGGNWLFWFSLMVPPAQEQAVWEALEPLAARYIPPLQPHGGWLGPRIGGMPIGYRYVICFKTFNPPLVYPRHEAFLMMGFMGLLGTGTSPRHEIIFALEREFVDIALQHQFRPYFQAENLGLYDDFRHYYGEEIYRTFKHLKESFDPLCLFNRGIFFPDGTDKPRQAVRARLSV